MEPLALVALVLLVGALALVFALAQQSVQDTQDLAWRIEQLLVRIVPPTGTGQVGEPTWFGLTIRLAHVGEFALVGLGMSLAVVAWRGPTRRGLALALGLCLAAAVADELHKLFVPGRHFDPADLLLDAAGFVPVVLVAFALAKPLQ